MKGLITLQDVTYDYPDGTRGLSDINLAINAGERVAILGANGAGKSTLLMSILGIARSKGSIVINGITMSDATLAEIRKLIGMVFQDPNDQLFCPTVFDDVAFGPRNMGWDSETIHHATHAALAAVAMEHVENRPAHHLSVGERRRVSIATALACDPPILAFDEPAAGLDPKRRAWLSSFIARSTKTIVLATHDLDFALATCTRAIVLHQHRLCGDGTAEEVIGNSELLQKAELK